MIPFGHYDPAHLAAPMASTSTIRLLFSLKARYKLYIEHFDITSAFLHDSFGYPITPSTCSKCVVPTELIDKER